MWKKFQLCTYTHTNNEWKKERKKKQTKNIQRNADRMDMFVFSSVQTFFPPGNTGSWKN